MPEINLENEQTEKPHLSKSSICMMLGCPCQFEFKYVKGIQSGSSAAMEVGIAFHKAVEHNYKNKIAKKIAAPLEEVLQVYQDTLNDAFESKEIALEPGQRKGDFTDIGVQICTAHYNEIAPNVNPLLVEYRFNLSLGKDFPWTLLGFIDVAEEDGTLRDHKAYSDYKARNTKQEEIDNDIQASLYWFGYWMTQNKAPKEFVLDMVIKKYPPKIKQFHTTRTRKEIEWILNLIQKIGNQIMTGIFPPNPTGWTCSPKWCSYWNLCLGKARANSKAA